ncbi:hypothetical protein TrispH2_008973 [Trichoplax sp. H2]|nr:hypothetical protein TrispH2_008973 [Trichoplax sp. H2]|eukprot:RDD39217.1 hypothetical protein TrispH2_008973 [Trichoplax sp. H2]
MLIATLAAWIIAALCTGPTIIGFWGKLDYDSHYGKSYNPANDVRHQTYTIAINDRVSS